MNISENSLCFEVLENWILEQQREITVKNTIIKFLKKNNLGLKTCYPMEWLNDKDKKNCEKAIIIGDSMFKNITSWEL